MFNQEEVKQTTLAHYTHLALNPAWKSHAWHQVNELAKEYPDMFSDLPEKLTASMPPKSSAELRKAGK